MSTNRNFVNVVPLLTELRSRLLYSLAFFFILLIILLYFANHLYAWLALPLLRFLPQGHLIATQIIAPFFVPFKLAMTAAVLLAAPFFFYQLWSFIAPALYGHERRRIWPFFLMSIILFYCGIAFAYLVIFPLLFHFLAGIAPHGVIISPDMSAYLDFSLKMLFVFGSLFEIPIIMVFLVSIQWVSRSRLIACRSYALLGAFIIGMLFAPPDVLSQTILAVPIYLLYESGIWLSRFTKKSI